jgi:uncharacterized protein YceK
MNKVFIYVLMGILMMCGCTSVKVVSEIEKGEYPRNYLQAEIEFFKLK